MTDLRRSITVIVLALSLVWLTGCTSDEGADMNSTEAAEQLRTEAAQLAKRLGDAEPEEVRDEYQTCKPNVFDGNVYYTYSTKVALFPEARAVMEDEVVPAMEAAGWTLRKRDSETYVAYDFDKDGFIVGASIPTTERGTGISVGGSSPCVEDDGTTGIIHDE